MSSRAERFALFIPQELCVQGEASHEFDFQTWRKCSPTKNEVRVKLVIGKAIPLQAWTGREVSRRLRLPDFKTIGT
jgi:hypothetical protein